MWWLLVERGECVLGESRVERGRWITVVLWDESEEFLSALLLSALLVYGILAFDMEEGRERLVFCGDQADLACVSPVIIRFDAVGEDCRLIGLRDEFAERRSFRSLRDALTLPIEGILAW